MNVHNLNLSESYVPNWGAWEVARELACNAIDADPENWTCETVSDSEILITTTTVPELAELFVIGHGTKSKDTDTIGQFGEGAKMAALAATRTKGGMLELRTPSSTVRFVFRKVLGVETLHAEVASSYNGPGFKARIVMPGVAAAYRGRIVPDMPIGPMRRQDSTGMRIFVKGVYVATIRGDAIYDWNLDNLDINRDREMVNEWQARWSIGQWLQDNMTERIARALLYNPEAIEANALEYHYGGNCATMLAAAFRDVFGGKAVLAIGTEADSVAARKGTHVTFLQPKLHAALIAGGVETSGKATNAQYDLVAVDSEPYRAQLAWLRQLDPIVKAPPVTVRVFEVRNDDLRGYAAFSDMIIWLSEGLFSAGNELELVRTYCHELAHFMTQAYDGSTGFEAGLDGIAGRLAMHILGGEL